MQELTIFTRQVKIIKKLPQIPDEISSVDLQKTLFVNAWDPFSMVGNGNAKDDSLDGQWGRISAMAVLCWPLTNPHIRYHPVNC